MTVMVTKLAGSSRPQRAPLQHRPPSVATPPPERSRPHTRQGAHLATAKLAAKAAAPPKEGGWPSPRYEVWLREAVTGMSYNGFPLDGTRRPCHPAYKPDGPARTGEGTGDPKGAKANYHKLCCETAETKAVVQQYHAIFGLKGWCDKEAYLEWENPEQKQPGFQEKKVEEAKEEEGETEDGSS